MVTQTDDPIEIEVVTQEEDDLAMEGIEVIATGMPGDMAYEQPVGIMSEERIPESKMPDTDHVRKPDTSESLTNEPDADLNIMEPEMSESKEITDHDVRKPEVPQRIAASRTLERTPWITGPDSENNIVCMLQLQSREPHTVTKPSHDEPCSLNDIQVE